VIAGEGEEHKSLEQQISGSELTEKNSPTGFREDN